MAGSGARPDATLAACAACILLALAPDMAGAQLAYHRHAIANGELWRLWTAHLVHFSFAQAVADAAVLLACGALAEQAIGSRRMAWLLLCAAPLVSAGLFALAPSMAEYRGASALATACAVLAAALLWRLGPWWRLGTAAAATAFATRTLLEAVSMPISPATLPDGVVVAWQSHLLGALAGAIAIAMFKPHRQSSKQEVRHAE